MTIYKKLLKIQTEIKANKNEVNSFGGYKYRKAETILQAISPLLIETGTIILLNNEIVHIEGRFYIKATASLIDVETGDKVEAIAYAREEETKAKMDGSQATGSSASYANKYALGNLLKICDMPDSDETNTHGKEEKQPQATATTKTITEKQEKFLLFQASQAGLTKEQVLSVIKKEYNLDAINVLNKTQFDAILARIEAKKAQ